MEKVKMSSKYVLMISPLRGGVTFRPVRLTKQERRDDHSKTIARLALYGENRTPDEGVVGNYKLMEVTDMVVGYRDSLEIYCHSTDTFPMKNTLSRKNLIIVRKDKKWFREIEAYFILNVIKEMVTRDKLR